MNWLGHYREAERLTEVAEGVDWQDGDPGRPNLAEYAQTALAAAQVHATLAQTAVLALQGFPGHDGPESVAGNTLAWDEEL